MKDSEVLIWYLAMLYYSAETKSCTFIHKIHVSGGYLHNRSLQTAPSRNAGAVEPLMPELSPSESSTLPHAQDQAGDAACAARLATAFRTSSAAIPCHLSLAPWSAKADASPTRSYILREMSLLMSVYWSLLIVLSI
jgi:hypothetical protein